MGGAVDLGHLRPWNASIERPKNLELLQEHGLDMFLGPFGFPDVFIHTEVIPLIVFIVNENIWVFLGLIPDCYLPILVEILLGCPPAVGKSNCR